MAELDFKGDIPGSKSVFNRALILQSYFPELQIQGFSNCDDVHHMRESLKKIGENSVIDCGEGGTTLRFLALRLSRVSGLHRLIASERLLQRPQLELQNILQQLGGSIQLKKDEVLISGREWRKPEKPLCIEISESSQFASAVLLNCWLLDFDLEIVFTGKQLSESYLQLTLELVRNFGMQVHKTPTGYMIPRGQKITSKSLTVEADVSSAFTMAAAGALAGEVLITNFPTASSQPDLEFLNIFKAMNVNFGFTNSQLKVKNDFQHQPVQWNLGQCPDLFPVLAVLCSWVPGTSKLYGAPHLTKKESNRIAKVSELFQLLGVAHEPLSDGMIVHGSANQSLRSKVVFNPDQDHRMVMAAALMKLKGHGVIIEQPEVINKSFPEFFSMIGLQP